LVAHDEPVGIFDSGVGGLSVLREIRKELPGEELLYVADSGYAPYGDRSQAFIEERSTAILEFLIQQRAKAVVVACNTATGAAIDTLRARFQLPIIGIEPAVKPAASATQSKVVGVMATTQTLSSPRFARLVSQYGAGVAIVPQACPGLAERVEEGELSGERIRGLLEDYIRPLLAQGADTIVLGCTHYAFLSGMIQEIAGPEVSVIDPAVAVARELRRRLEAIGKLSTKVSGSERFWTSGRPDAVQRVVSALWKPVTIQSL
jgi:glutamate racemase